MVKRKPSGSKTRRIPRGSRPGPHDAKADGSWFSPAAIRETIESVIIAFVLAFLFRTFEAEAFVIPTGSMAPTLMGKHKDLECPMCHYRYQVSASDRQDSEVASTVFRSHLPDVPLHGRPNPPECPEEVVSQLRWRPHPGCQVSLRVRRSETLGRYRFQVPRQRHDELHQAAGRPAWRDHQNSLRRFVDPRSRATRRANSRSPANRPKKCWPCFSPSMTTIWRPRSRASWAGPRGGRPSRGLARIRGPTARIRRMATFPRSRSTTAPRARPGSVTGIGCRRTRQSADRGGKPDLTADNR